MRLDGDLRWDKGENSKSLWSLGDPGVRILDFSLLQRELEYSSGICIKHALRVS